MDENGRAGGVILWLGTHFAVICDSGGGGGQARWGGRAGVAQIRIIKFSKELDLMCAYIDTYIDTYVHMRTHIRARAHTHTIHTFTFIYVVFEFYV